MAVETMTAQSAPAAPQADAAAVRQCLDRAVRDRFGADAVIQEMHRRRCEFSSSYEAEIIDLTLGDGRTTRMFLKNYGVFRNRKEGMAERREREMRVFRDLLVRTDLGTPKYQGTEWNEADGRLWLVLEFVEAAQLRHVEFKHWVAALGWLGRMQAQVAPWREELLRLPYLIRHDEAFFHATARLALDVVARVSGPLGARLFDVVRRYDPLVKTMASQPSTLIHGAYRPPNVLVVVGVGGATERICPIDWEEASLGSPLYDVAYLSDGFKPPRVDEMWDAYRREAEPGGVPVPERQEMERLVNHFRVHKLFNLLGKALHRKYPIESVEKMIGMAEALVRV